MALPILDGNQSATTLSTIFTAGAHIPAHTVVSLGSQAISDIGSAVSGISVSIGGTQSVTGSVSVLNFPATQTIAGTVTANVTLLRSIAQDDSIQNVRLGVDGLDCSAGDGRLFSEIVNKDGSSAVDSDGQAFVRIKPTSSTTITIGSIPAISGTVTASLVGWDSGNNEILRIGGYSLGAGDSNRLALEVVGPSYDGAVVISGLPAVPIYGTVTVGNSVTIGSLPAISGTVTASIGVNSNGPVYVADSAFPTNPNHLVAVGGYDSNANELRMIFVDGSGRTIISGTVTAAAPNGSLTTRFGTPTTANTAFATSAVTNANRKYLLIQNVTTGSNVITVGIGFTPTTTQGIQLTAGAGITFESSYIPTGQIFVLSSVTASNFTILEA